MIQNISKPRRASMEVILGGAPVDGEVGAILRVTYVWTWGLVWTAGGVATVMDKRVSPP